MIKNASAREQDIALVVESDSSSEQWTVPHAADTAYHTHGYYRYVGKYPPQIAAKLIADFYPGRGTILDPMVGGGTLLAEATMRGIPAVGWDINPVSLLISRCVSRAVDPKVLAVWGELVLNALRSASDDAQLFTSTLQLPQPKPLKLSFCDEYFSPTAKRDLAIALQVVEQATSENRSVGELLLLIVLASLRRISFANVKKMNLELDLTKKTLSTLEHEFARRFTSIAKANRALPQHFGDDLAQVVERDATVGDWPGTYAMVVLHPPYLTNTAFSEATQLQLAILGVGHKSVWKRELRCRGSFLHEPNGLQKYLVNWGHVLAHSAAALSKRGRLAVVVGDGQIDYVRIPVGAITLEQVEDLGLRLIHRAFHVLNNHTGQTQNKKMKGQHVYVFEKP